jgi:hypothetical protein
MRYLSAKTNVKTPDSEYPYGRIKDNPGDNSGTPFNELLYGDIQQFFARMFAVSGMVANGFPDNAYTGFQLYEALRIAAFPYLYFSARVSQSSTSIPTSTSLPGNTLSGITWTRTGVGIYKGVKTGAFASGDVLCLHGGSTAGIVKIVPGDQDGFFIFTTDFSGVASDDVLSSTSIEIRVYR